LIELEKEKETCRCYITKK